MHAYNFALGILYPLLLRILRPGADIHPKFSLPRGLKSAVLFLRTLLCFCHYEGQGSREALFFVFLKSSTDLLVTRQKIQILFNVRARKWWWSGKPECKVQQINHQTSALRALHPLMSQYVAVVVTILGRKEYWR